MFQQVSALLNWWRGTQTNQNQLSQSLVTLLQNNQRAGDCNRLIGAIENVSGDAGQEDEGNHFNAV